MSGVLESLKNPLERLEVLPTTMSLRTNPDISSPSYNSPEWLATLQYFKNDVVVSPIDGKAYVFTGGTADLTSVRGGGDPSTNADWTSLSGGGGGGGFESFVPTFANGGAGVITVGNADLVDAPSGSVWSMTLQGGSTIAGLFAAGDTLEWTLTSSGVGSSPVKCTILPDVGAATFYWSCSLVVDAGTGAAPLPTIALTGSYVGAAGFPTISDARITWSRLA